MIALGSSRSPRREGLDSAGVIEGLGAEDEDPGVVPAGGRGAWWRLLHDPVDQPVRIDVDRSSSVGVFDRVDAEDVVAAAGQVAVDECPVVARRGENERSERPSLLARSAC